MDDKNKNQNQNKKEQVHGYWVQSDNQGQPGVHFLQNNLEKNEVLPYFNQAKRSGSADFEDQSGVDWKIIHNKADNTYVVTRR